MGHPQDDKVVRRFWAGMLDPIRWLKDGMAGFLLGFIGVILLGTRPRGCKPVAIRTGEGEFHGCGRACRYGRPLRFVPLCRHCRVRFADGRNLALCGAGNDPLFALFPSVFVSLLALLVGTLVVVGLFVLCAGGVRLPPSPGARPAAATERAVPGAEGRQPAAPGSAPAVDVPRATPREPVYVPSALERFRLIQKQSEEATPGDSAPSQTKPDGTAKDAAAK